MSDDLFGKLGRGFSQIGSRVKEGAIELKKTAGIGVGRIDLHLDRSAFRPGDEIRGRVTLALTEPTRASKLVVALLGTRQRVSYDKAGGRTTQRRHDETVCEIERELVGEGEFHDQEYAFSLTVPSDAKAAPHVADGGVLGDVARVVSAVASARHMPTSWRVVATLDIPWKRNVTRKVDISLLD